LDLNLKGKKVFVTGGSVGIGLASARKFAEEGADVAIEARDKERVYHPKPGRFRKSFM